MRNILFILLIIQFSQAICQTKYIPKEIDSTYSYVDSIGKIILKTNFDYVTPFKYNLARVKKNDKWGFIDTTGKVIVPIVYDYVNDFSDSLAIVTTMRGCDKENLPSFIYRYKCKEKYGFVDLSGKVTMTNYSYIENFKNGYARVFKTPWWKINETLNIKWFSIDKHLVEYNRGK